MVATLSERLGTDLAVDHVDPRPGDVRHSQADQSWLRSLFPDVAEVAFPEGLAQTVEWFRAIHR